MRSNLTLSLLALGLPFLASLSASAQSGSVGVRVQATDSMAIIHVDGTPYKGSASFVWPIGSKHTLEIRGTVQTLFDERSRVRFDRWTDPRGLLNVNNLPTVNITADPASPVFIANFVREHRVDFIFHSAVLQPDGKYLGTWPGNIISDGQCITFDSSQWVEHGRVIPIQATPSPGYIFLGWDMGDGSTNGFLRQFAITTPLVLRGLFSLASRATFYTSPPELQVLVNRQRIQTRRPLEECELGTSPFDGPPVYPPPMQPVVSSGGCATYLLCSGSLDLLPGSEILLGAEAVQVDKFGVTWAFDSWELPNGIVEKKNNVLYRVPGPPAHVMPTAKFVRAAQVEIRSNPRDLKLVVDGGETKVSLYYFAPGTTHRISAPTEQVDSRGRRYRFTGWSNGGPAEQELNVPADAFSNPFVVVASYELLGQLTLRSDPSGTVLQIGDSECRTPCTLDRAVGAALSITAPVVRPVSEESRWEFRGWSDGGDPVRTFTFTDGAITLTARYQLLHRLLVTADPPEGATFQIQPASPDGFHAQGTRVTIDVEAQPGYKFRRWDGVLAGSVSTGEVLLSAPAVAIAKMEKVPYVSPTGVRSAAGETTDGTVAPGSAIEIFGANLAKEYQEAKSNPLPQSLQGVTVDVAGTWLPILSVSPDAIRAQLPADLAEGEHKLTVTLVGQSPLNATFKAARNAPAIFLQTDRDPPLAFATKENGRIVTSDNPARPGEVITVWGAGFGPTSPSPLAGFRVPLNPPYPLADALELISGDRVWPHLFAGAAPDQVGFSVVRFRVDAAMPRPGNLELFVRINGKTSPLARLPVQ